MIKSGIDQEALVRQFSEASAKQGEALRKAVADATLKALQGRELTLANIRKVLKTVTEAASAGAAQNPLPAVDVEDLLAKAFDGMDGALLQAVEANRKALSQFVGQGVGVQDKQMKSALANLEKFEDMFFDTVTKAAKGAGQPLQGPWDHVLGAMKDKGTLSGAQASLTVEELVGQAQTALRDGRAIGLKATQALMDSYAALVSGVLIGMSEGLQQGTGKAAPAEAKARRK
jgi:hypothetical protein